MSRTIKDIEAQIKELEQEKAGLEKLEQLKDVLGTTTLTVAQIKKLIKDAEKNNKVNNKVDKLKKEKIVKKVSSGKPRYVQEKVCTECRNKFEAHSPRQMVCPECKKKITK